MANWEHVRSIELDTTPVFYHVIKILDSKGMLLDSIKVKPEKGFAILQELSKKWRDWEKENGIT